jgi:hypothetical protein
MPTEPPDVHFLAFIVPQRIPSLSLGGGCCDTPSDAQRQLQLFSRSIPAFMFLAPCSKLIRQGHYKRFRHMSMISLVIGMMQLHGACRAEDNMEVKQFESLSASGGIWGGCSVGQVIARPKLDTNAPMHLRF